VLLLAARALCTVAGSSEEPLHAAPAVSVRIRVR
jgi:hypothetical protein